MIDDKELVSLKLNNAPIEQVLNRLFNEENGLKYEIIDKTIIISKTPVSDKYFKRPVTGIVTDSQGSHSSE